MKDSTRAVSTGRTPAAFRRVLAAIDLSPISDRIVGRVARLPLAADARITLLHVIPSGLPTHARRQAIRDAKQALAEEVEALGRQVGEGVGVDYILKIGSAAAEIARRATARKDELIVMGRGGARALRTAILGSTAERVLRRSKLPVLVVRLPARARYRRPALALERDAAAPLSTAMLFRMVPRPRPVFTVIHAFDIPYPGSIYPSQSPADARACREEYRRTAIDDVASLLATAVRRAGEGPADPPRWTADIHYGPARDVIEASVKRNGTDLLVIGTRGHGGAVEAFLGTVSGDVLREVKCDVLVVPPRGR